MSPAPKRRTRSGPAARGHGTEQNGNKQESLFPFDCPGGPPKLSKNMMLARLRSSTDAQGNPKSEARLQKERERANRIEDISRNMDTMKLATQIKTAELTRPDDELENVIIAFFANEVKAQEARQASTAPPSAILLRDFSAQDSATRRQTLNETMDKTIASMLARLRSSTDAQGNPKSETRLQKERERANRIEDISRNMDPVKLVAQIKEAERREPDAELENVIVAYFANEVKAQEARQASTAPSAILLRDFNAQDAATRRQTLNDTLDKTISSMLVRLRSPTDAQGNPKSEARLQKERERANRIEDIARNMDTMKLAAQIIEAGRSQPNAELENVIVAYFANEVKAQEAAQANPVSKQK